MDGALLLMLIMAAVSGPQPQDPRFAAEQASGPEMWDTLNDEDKALFLAM